MKRTGLLLAFLLVFLTLTGEPVSRDLALRVAENWLNHQNRLRDVTGDISHTDHYVHEVNGETIFYIYDFEPEGFVIVAADDASVPILGYNVKGQSGLGDFPPNFTPFLEMYEQGILEIRENRLSNRKTLVEWEAIETNTIPIKRDFDILEPLLETRWNQDDPWNQLCPAHPSGPGGHVYAGCVAVAMGQAMKYWEHPQQGTGSNSYYHFNYGWLSADFGATTYDWDDIPNISATLSTAELLFHLGVSVEMWYSPNGSGANSSDARDALIQYFGYNSSAQLVGKDNYSNTGWINLLKDQLNALQPLYYNGYGDSAGHAFNCDGYDADDRFHFNWGWGGSQNGYFHTTLLNPGGSDFSLGQGAIINLYPAGNYSFPPSNLSAVPGNGQISLSWDEPFMTRDAGRNYQGFNVYRDNQLINSLLVLETGYVDHEVENNVAYQYYVTAVYPDGESRNSNQVTATPSIAEPPSAGTGSNNDPYEIASIENLFWIFMNRHYWDQHFVQSVDLDLSDTVNWFDGEGWPVIGNGSVHFTGIYDGQGHSIDNLYICKPQTTDLGLFGSLNGATIKNLVLNSSEVTGFNNVGGLAGSIYDTGIINCQVSGNVNGTGSYVGGVVGLNRESLISDSYSTGEVSAAGNFVGGLTGFNRDALIEKCYTSAVVNGTATVGGLSGWNYYSQINNCFSLSNVSGDSNVGGLVGWNYDAEVSNSYSTGSVTGNTSIGGLIGLALNGETYTSYWNVETSGLAVSAGGEGRTTEDMTYPYSPDTYLDWDFVSLWAEDTDSIFNSGYPYLRDLILEVDDEHLALPGQEIISNYPNPFNPETTITFSLSHTSIGERIRLEIYNIRGQKVRTLFDGIAEKSSYSLVWNGQNDRGSNMPSGVYYYRLTTPREATTNKMLLLK